MLKYVRFMNEHQYRWNGQSLPVAFKAVIKWPDGRNELLDCTIEHDVADHLGLEYETLFVKIDYRGFKGHMPIAEDDLGMVQDIII